jgi:hypothetical protein
MQGMRIEKRSQHQLADFRLFFPTVIMEIVFVVPPLTGFFL